MSALCQKQTFGATLLFDRLVSAWAAKRNCHQGPKLTAVASPCAQRAQIRSFAYLPLTALRWRELQIQFLASTRKGTYRDLVTGDGSRNLGRDGGRLRTRPDLANPV